VTPILLLRAFTVWLVIISVETVHAVMRRLLLVPLVGDLPARKIGVPIGSLLIFAVAYFCIRWVAARAKLQLLGVGLLWIVLIVLFEIGLGRLVLDLPWDRIAEDYDPARGGFLGLGLLFMAVSPPTASTSLTSPPWATMTELR
jgi:hypothetical protein